MPPNFLVFSVLPFTFTNYGPPLFFKFFTYIYLISNTLHNIFLTFYLSFFYTNFLRHHIDNIYVTN